MKRQGDEEEGSRKRPKGAVEVSEGKLFQLWGKGYTKEERAAMQLDETAVYSVTDARTADRITTHMLALEGAPFRLVADGCGCVGGNSLSFGRALAKQGGRVMAIELDPIRFAMLENNVRVSGLVETVTCVCGDSAQLVLDPTAPRDAGAQRAWTALREAEACPFLLLSPTTCAQVLFLDPPWGGKQVDVAPPNTVELEMSGTTISDLCRRVATPDFAIQHVLLKLPPSYKFDKLKEDLSDVANVAVETAYRKMVLVVVSFSKSLTSEVDAQDKPLAPAAAAVPSPSSN